MRALAIFAALALVTAPVLVAPTVAYADGIERPRPRPRPRPRRPTPPPPMPAPPVIIEEGPETVTLPDSFFASTGGVGADVGLDSFYSSSTTVIIRGGSAHASAFAFASARASAGVGGHFGARGGHGRGHGCGCR
ncbi:MAG TPA: hypothetical protein VEF55_03895 [Candidatus Binatia bacterium]|nr:hypothetical protein [Candidatus Binatia bacterium]